MGVRRVDGAARVAVIEATGDNDAFDADGLERALEEARPTPVVVDLTQATFVDSTFVGTLLAASRSMPLAIVVPRDAQNAVVKLFELTHLFEALPVYRGREEAVAALVD
jgi:anti-anti-sigma factor